MASFLLPFYGGDGEIRTLELVSELHDFQSQKKRFIMLVSRFLTDFRLRNIIIQLFFSAVSYVL